MRLESFSVEGLRSLSKACDIPVGKPTILTGANDAGKSTTLQGVGFLLGAERLTEQDLQVLDHDNETGAVTRVEQCVVTGRFLLSAAEQEELGLEEQVTLRRVAVRGGETRYEMLTLTADEEDLRSLHARPLKELQAIGEKLSVEPNGSRGTKQSWIVPLQEIADSRPQVEAWVTPSSGLIEHLPQFLSFASTAEPDPQREISILLRGAYKEILADETLSGRVAALERTVRKKLATKADALVGHLKTRCPDLSEVSVTPAVSFENGFSGAELRTGEGHGVGLAFSGAGRRRRISLAVWEWTNELLGAGDVVVAYDEPDVHLDYGRQRELMDLVLDQSSKDGVSVLVATHALNLIDRVDIRDVVHLRRDEKTGVTSVDLLMSDEQEETQRYLAEVSTAMGLRNSVLLHERCFVGVEGPTEQQCLPVLFGLTMGMSVAAAGIAVISGNGNEGALRVTQFLNQHGRKVAFVVDRDSETDQSTKKLFSPASLEKIGIKPEQIHLVGTAELEDCFTDEQWAATANKHWQHREGRLWLADEFSQLRTKGKLSKGLDSMIRPEAKAAPPGKPGYLLALVQDLKSADEVPQELRDVFESLAKLAN